MQRFAVPGDKAMSKAASRPREYDEYDEYDDEYDEYDEYEDERSRGGLFSTPARAITIIGSVLMLVVLFAGIGWLLASRGSDPPTGPAALGTAPRVGYAAPDFALTDVKTNQTVQLSSLRGKPVWINFWGTWCPPCREEMPIMQKMYDRVKGDVEIIGVSMGPRDYPEQVVNFVNQYKYTWTFVHDPHMDVMNQYIVQGIPASYFIDKDGVIRAIAVGGAPEAMLEQELAKIYQ
jgi:cytochrome c biogenesis protein CcmG/thiol:disulfide interchange protein DsbE